MRHFLLSLPLLALCLGGTVQPALAQDEDPGTTRTTRTRGMEVILRNLTRGSGFTVLADSSLTEAQAANPREAITPQNLEAQLTLLVRSLPAGTVWTKVMLPATSRSYRGDDLVDYIEAQTKLLGKKVSSDPNVVEVLGQKLPQETPVVSALNLKPVYVIYNPTSRARAGAVGADGSPDVNKMLQSFMNMDPNTRQQMMRGMMQQFGSMMQNMSPEQRMDFVRSMRGAFPGGPGGPGGQGGPGNGGRIPPQTP